MKPNLYSEPEHSPDVSTLLFYWTQFLSTCTFIQVVVGIHQNINSRVVKSWVCWGSIEVTCEAAEASVSIPSLLTVVWCVTAFIQTLTNQTTNTTSSLIVSGVWLQIRSVVHRSVFTLTHSLYKYFILARTAAHQTYCCVHTASLLLLRANH